MTAPTTLGSAEAEARWREHLLTMLQVAVPLHMQEMRNWANWLLLAEARRAADIIAAEGDVLQFAGRRGEAAHAFNGLAKGLAVLAYRPGGVTFAGVHWCANHTSCESGEAGLVVTALRSPTGRGVRLKSGSSARSSRAGGTS